MGNKLYLCVDALLCGWGENIMQVGVYSSSPGIRDRPLTTIVVVAHNKDREKREDHQTPHIKKVN